ncbi:FAD-dependent oxidoreductase [uncultured Ferrovibrio sp.]|jgi:2-polyprenyl-6-methoxyphenol hydroxylase and related FAD-dependent oxidoreductases|uniref:FAD-dependent oxidoreductase n=1 Tax=uncultured Ferrovibrio sp. TaxID=1576913 RepID=UPI00262454E3|nr:FAD-dependent oxidoreductase [uncultured Ferrovibrio sp.]
MAAFAYPQFGYTAPKVPRGGSEKCRVAIVGGGPVGLTAALDLAQHGISCILLDEEDTVSVGSRAICYAKRTLEIWDRLGVGERMLKKGVTWQVGKVFHGASQCYSFDLLPESGHRFPAFINLQQYYAELYLVEAAQARPEIELRWKHRVYDVVPGNDGVRLSVTTPDGDYTLIADYVLAADGARSTVRRKLGLDFRGQVFEDRFLIADVRMKADFPTERWFWFDPPFHAGGSALLHKQPDDVWRIDLQLGWQADPEVERQPERVLPRLKAMLGENTPFELEWISVYTFQCRRLDRFRHGRVLFIGDSAHQVSPFGARGANSGIQDVDNLVWKLALVMQGEAPETLLDSYDLERVAAADENILHSTRSTDFIVPRNNAVRALRDAVLGLADEHAFARRLVNSGRLSMPATYRNSVLSTPDTEAFEKGPQPGAPAIDAPIDQGKDWLLRRCQSGAFTLISFNGEIELPSTLQDKVKLVTVRDEGLAADRYSAAPGTAYLLRPDQHVAARWRRPSSAEISRAYERAIGRVA